MEHGSVSDVSAPRRRATYADLVAVPEHLVAEIVDGELITSPRPASPHALAASALGSVVFGHLWFVDPLARMVEVHRLADGRWVVEGAHDGLDPLRAAPFDAVALDVRRWWGEAWSPALRSPPAISQSD